MDGAEELLRTLHRAGFALAVGSSGPRDNVTLALDRLGTGSLFRVVVTGADVTRGKPDPQVFTLAAERLGIAPNHCAVIEDSPYGVAAANAAGMTSIGLLSNPRANAPLEAAHARVRFLRELSPEMIAALIETKLSESA
jgi:beta-phosphoglucomutase